VVSVITLPRGRWCLNFLLNKWEYRNTELQLQIENEGKQNVDIIRMEFSIGSVITDTADRYGPIITVGAVVGVGGDFSHTAPRSSAI